MKTIVAIRHAKSSWDDPQLDDIDRPLNGRGKRNADEMGYRLNQRKLVFDVFLVSPAKRARKTAKRIIKQLDYSPEQLIHDDLYTFTGSQLLQTIQSFSDQFQTIAFVGHNPAITEVVNRLTNNDIDNIPTCGIAVMTLKNDFYSDIRDNSGTLDWYDFPKNT